MLTVSLSGDKREFFPKAVVEGTATWHMENPPGESSTDLELNLFYYTSGRGDQDLQIVQSLPLANQPVHGSQHFSFILPPSPYSFSGKLISLIWAVELVCGDDAARVEFVMAPNGREIKLTEIQP
mgnify:CR=1 FL=1